MDDHEPIEILLVEDNPADARLTREALREAHIANNIHVAGDGEDGLAFLRREGSHAHAPRPDLILLDLNLPRMNGHEVLARIKDDPDLKDIPVVILTTSEEVSDIKKSYTLQASSFVTKPVDLEKFLRAVHDLGVYWFTVVRLPPSERAGSRPPAD